MISQEQAVSPSEEPPIQKYIALFTRKLSDLGFTETPTPIEHKLVALEQILTDLCFSTEADKATNSATAAVLKRPNADNICALNLLTLLKGTQNASLVGHLRQLKIPHQHLAPEAAEWEAIYDLFKEYLDAEAIATRDQLLAVFEDVKEQPQEGNSPASKDHLPQNALAKWNRVFNHAEKSCASRHQSLIATIRTTQTETELLEQFEKFLTDIKTQDSTLTPLGREWRAVKLLLESICDQQLAAYSAQRLADFKAACAQALNSAKVYEDITLYPDRTPEYTKWQFAMRAYIQQPPKSNQTVVTQCLQEFTDSFPPSLSARAILERLIQYAEVHKTTSFLAILPAMAKFYPNPPPAPVYAPTRTPHSIFSPSANSSSSPSTNSSAYNLLPILFYRR